ncbi:MAG: NUDIX domain-containing protein [Clostridia bacterium]|nr:NUDIX domain-containing protein [Clostridia bacterium]
MSKRGRARAIVIVDNKLVAMYRERDERVYYTFPGGGMESGESEVDCVKREVFEEFGIVVEPIKKVYVYENELSVEHFYVAKYVSGKFGSGQGEEFQGDKNRGIYIPKMIDIKEIQNLPLMPPEVAKTFLEDFAKNGKELRDDVLTIKANLQ